jgi:dihydroxyacetone kinase-like predicted kinase
MTEGALSVATGEITQAVRDTKADIGSITAGDWIGIVRGDGIVAVSGLARRRGVCLARAPHHAGTRDRDRHHRRRVELPRTPTCCSPGLHENRPDVQVEVHRGGQPLYPYLFGVE